MEKRGRLSIILKGGALLVKDFSSDRGRVALASTGPKVALGAKETS